MRKRKAPRVNTHNKNDNNNSYNNNEPWGKKVEEEIVDGRGFPIHRIALLCGPPGLGKTTLAHIVAKHAGYNVVEINASDDRGRDTFRQALLSSTQMKSMIGADPRPNCLLLDEIDEAPAASIDLLIKFVQGKLVTKGKKPKDGSSKNEGCKRPIVCICNEAYTPSLSIYFKPLRLMVYVVNVSKVSIGNLVERLTTIAGREKLRVGQGTLLQSAEKSGCDIRSCLGALQYMGEDCEKNNISLGSKDTKNGLFDTWREMLQIPLMRSGPLSIRERVQRILHASHNDTSERLTQGIFENYAQNCEEQMDNIAASLEWFQFYDKITTTVMTKNDWRVMPYSNYAFVSWHLGFSSLKNPKLTYPHAGTEANQKLDKNKAILGAAQRSCGYDRQTIILDLAPYIFELINPRLRGVSTKLYSAKEKLEFDRLINVMLDLGITLIQERKEAGLLEYEIEPNLLEIGIFPQIKTRRGLDSNTKQMIVQTLLDERIKRASQASLIPSDSPEEAIIPVKIPRPIKLTDVEPILVPQEKKCRDFFAAFKPVSKPIEESSQSTLVKTLPTAVLNAKTMSENILNYGVSFKYKEGYSNAIRRTVQTKDFI